MKKFFFLHKKIDNICVYKFTNFKDSRGKTFSIFFKKNFKNLDFVHDKISYGIKHSLRGMHSDDKTHKLITGIFGKIHCKIVNFNKNSKYYLNQYSFNLDQNYTIYIPPKHLLGWCVLSDHAIISYKFSYKGKYNDCNKQETVRYDSDLLNLKWPINKKKIILSERDNLSRF